MAATEPTSSFAVPAALDWLGALAHGCRRLGIRLGDLESRVLEHELQAVTITSPIYICGLARSGSTLLHEIVTSHPAVATLRVRDYPFVATPVWWRKATASLPKAAPKERAHQDGILIAADSPDSLEEMVWMAFFPKCHDPATNAVLGSRDDHPTFTTFYRNHLRKVLLAENATRYAAKANYHVARLAFLLRQFPDARFLIAVRDPVSHIASLVRQHQLFSAGQRGNGRALRYMQRSGHFEFGLDRRPINLGNGCRVRLVLDAWERGDEIRGWARYWAMTHDFLADLLESNEAVKRAAMIVRFESMCDTPAETIRTVMEHCRLPEAEPAVARFAPTIRRPNYYSVPFSSADLAVIWQEAGEAAKRWTFVPKTPP